MIINKSDLDQYDGPKYLGIVELIEAAMQSGELKENDRLPPQRDLAKYLGVTVGTITRAFSEAEIKGLVRGEVGRGTYVIPNQFTSPSSLDEINSSGEYIGLAASDPKAALEDTSIFKKSDLPYDCTQLVPLANAQALVNDAMAEIQSSGQFAQLFDYTSTSFLANARESISTWVNRIGTNFTRNNMVMCYGAQHALSVIVAGLSEPGDIIVTENLSYPGIQAMASRLHRRQVIGVDLDEHGMIPESLEFICARYHPKFLMTVPSLHNPTSITVPKERREAIAEIAKAHDLIIIEDDVYRHLVADAPPTYAQMLPDRTCYIGSFSKSVLPGVRLGFVGASVDKIVRLRAALRSSIWMVSPLLITMAKTLVEQGGLEQLHAEERQLIRHRQSIAQRMLGEFDIEFNPESMHVWLRLPEEWTAVDFAKAAKDKGIALLPSWLFAINKDAAPEAVRISLVCIPEEDRLIEALEQIAEIARSVPNDV